MKGILLILSKPRGIIKEGDHAKATDKNGKDNTIDS